MKKFDWVFILSTSVIGDYFTEEPESKTVIQGNSVTLQCLVDENETSKLNIPSPYMIQWVKGNLALGFPPLRRERYDQKIGPKNFSLTIEDAQADDEEDFECQITAIGFRSKVARLSVLVPPKSVKIEGSRQNHVIDVVEGQLTHVKCAAEQSRPNTDLQWSITDVDGSSYSDLSVNDSGLINSSSSFVFTPSRRDQLKKITCKASHPALTSGDLEVITTLNVLTAPEIQLNVDTGGLFAGKDLTAECQVISANPAVEKFVWKIGNYELSESSSKIVIEDLSHLYHGEKISCFAENSVAVMSEEQLLDIKYAPKLLETTSRAVADLEESTSLSCIFGGNPEPEITWFKESKIVGSGNRLLLNSVSRADSGVFTCVGLNSLGSQAAQVDLVIRGPPVITSENEQTGAFSCRFLSEPEADFVRVVDLASANVIFSTQDFPENELRLKVPRGHYECQVENSFGSASSIIRLTDKGLTAPVKAGMVVGVLLLAVLLLAFVLIKLNFLSRRQFKINMNESEAEKACSQIGPNHSRQDYEKFSSKPLIISRPFIQGDQTLPPSLSDKSKNLDDFLKPVQPLLGEDLKLEVEVNAGSLSTNRSNHDDGYGTESGSGQKESTSSTASNNTDFEIEPSSKLRVIWDDSVQSSISSNRQNFTKQRSVSHV